VNGPPSQEARRRAARARQQAVIRRRRAVALLALLGVVVLGVVVASALGGGGSKTGGTSAARSSASAGGTGTAAAAGGTTAAVKNTGSVTIAWAGDVVPASSDRSLPGDPSTLLGSVASSLRSADVAIVNLEGTLTTRNGSKCGGSSDGTCFAFRAPPSYATSVFKAAGVDVANLANNHAEDFGPGGRADTVAALDHAGIAHAGGPGEVAVVQVRGIRVAYVGFSTYRWSANLNSPAAVTALVRKARAQADLLIVGLHGGAEGASATHVPHGRETFLGEDRGDLRAFARTAVAAGADLVVGSGPHVVRGMEFVDGRLVAYSTGNFCGYGGVFAENATTTPTAILRVTLRADRTLAAARIVPTRLRDDGTAAPDPEGRAIALIRSLSTADFGPSAAQVGADGTVSARA
jgi:poly-gamma-glutamate capsule biosynthesis protein CapA/YwtB (metallophosphatase superfamily)